MGRGKSAGRLQLRAACYEILEQIQPASVRAVCYQLFNVYGLIPSMHKNETNKVGTEIREAREAEEIPWEWIVDETRAIEVDASWNDPEAFAKSIVPQYRRDRWRHQAVRLEVWSEKSTVSGTLRPVLEAYGVPYRPMHGFTSATKIHDAAALTWSLTKPLVILYVGDFDPSGLYMSEADAPRRLAEYGATCWFMRRLALIAEQCRGLRPFPVGDKRGDPRYHWFVAEYGTQCWELDAMNPNDLREVVETAILAYIDRGAWNQCALAEEAEAASLRTVLTAWQQGLQPSG